MAEIDLRELRKFAIELLLKYSDENQISTRSTSDLSPLENYLIIELYKHSKK